MKKDFLCAFCLVLSLTVFASAVEVGQLHCEHLENPVGIGFQQPRLSWKLQSDRIGEVQRAYQIHAASSASDLESGKSDLWDSGKTISDQSVLVPWAGKSIGSRSQVFWQVRIWDKDDKPSAWSDIASFELGLLNSATEWRGKWITADLPRYDIEQSAFAKSSWINAGSTANQAAAARLILELPTNAIVRDATIDAAADGLITIYVNGQPTRQGSTSRTAPLHADIGAQLSPGKNIIAIGSAAVRGAVRRDSGSAGRNAIAAHGIIELENGQRIEFNTDGSWKSAVAPDDDWFATAFDDSSWSAATVLGPYDAQPSKYSDDTIGAGRYLRKNFVAKKSVVKARLYATALGVYEISLNGQLVNNNSVLDPGWTDYKKRVMVQTYDVTKLLSNGENAIAVVLGDGWYAGRVGWMGLAQYGTRPVFAAQLEITYTDGSTDLIATDESWKADAGEIIGSDLQWGEIIDARKGDAGWNKSSFNDSAWSNAVVEEHSISLDPQLGPPVRRLMELTPQKIFRRGDAWIVDFGQNMVGHVRLSARGDAGTIITVRHAEMLNTNESLYTENLRTALSTDTFILKGGGRETFEPHFTFHGFRYVEITGYPGKLTAEDLRGIVLGSDTPRTGTFECSDAELNRLYENILWGQRGNFLSVPTDCPQRDERMGWMGDAQVFAPTAARNADVSAFFTKWMVDVDDAQGPKGEFSTVSPRANQNNSWPVWGDAGVIIPWAMFVAYGDKNFLADNYDQMARWVDYCKSTAPNLIFSGGVGDHLAPRPTPVNIVDTAYFANSARIVAKAAAILGKTENAAKYDALRRDIVAAFNTAFVGADGSITGVDGGRGRAPVPYTPPPPGATRTGNTQTAFLLALQFDLLPENLRALAAQRLAENVETNGHLTTGFVGVGLICPVLTQIGRSDLAWQLVFTDTYPSWLFSVKNGATTIWERWDGWTPERGFQDSSMNSFNHYSLGSVGAWFYSGAAGIQPDESQPGYKHFFLRPQFTTRLSYVKASLDSPYGIISSHWHVEKNQMIYEVTIPPNTSADLILPVAPEKVRQSGKPLADKSGATTKLSLVAGAYQFSFPRESIK
ncbi:MAG TPA: family 78 glycoside hydrolase catalytic domain [Verrucomicrobiae bacterium]|jgi:alpha-L-rhamnosidase